MSKLKPWEPPSAAQVREKWDRIVDDMLDVRRSYWLNYEYHLGNQWLSWDDANASPTILSFADEEEAATRVTVNKLKPRTLSLLARSTRVPLAFEPRPDGVDSMAQRRALVQKQVLEVTAHRHDWEAIRADEVLHSLLGAVSAVSVEPDWEYDDDPIDDMETGETIPVPSRPIVKLTALSAAEFGLEPGTRAASDARYWIRCTTLVPEQAQELYELDYVPSPDSAAAMSVLHRALYTRRGKNLRRNHDSSVQVLVYYERPTKRSPGCVVHVIGGKIVYQSGWPFPFRTLNLAIFVQTPVGATWKGETVLNDARELQRNYNRAFTSINRHIGKADNARMILPMGAILDDENDLTGDAGEIIRVDPNAGEPHWMNAPQIPRWLREHIEKIEMELDDLFSTHAISRGQQVGDRNSGLALSILAEKDETPLGPMATSQQRGWQRIGEMVLATMRHLLAGVDSRLELAGQQPMRVHDVYDRGDGQMADVTWGAADLAKRPVVHVPLESVMPRSQAAIMDAMMKLAQSFPELFQGMTPAQLAAVLRTPDAASFAAVRDTQTMLARWENSRMIVGAQDEEVFPDDWHDHAKHIAEHNDLRASADYREASPEIQQYIDDHIDAHVAMQLGMQQPAPAEPGTPAGPELPGDPAALPPIPGQISTTPMPALPMGPITAGVPA